MSNGQSANRDVTPQLGGSSHLPVAREGLRSRGSVQSAGADSVEELDDAVTTHILRGF